MVSMQVLSHHHHDGADICMESHRCDNCCDDHEHGAEDAENCASCVAETLYTDRFERRVESGGCGLASCDHEWHGNLFAILYFCAPVFVDTPEPNSDTGKYINLYRSAETFSTGGLRAPPVILC